MAVKVAAYLERHWTKIAGARTLLRMDLPLVIVKAAAVLEGGRTTLDVAGNGAVVAVRDHVSIELILGEEADSADRAWPELTRADVRAADMVFEMTLKIKRAAAGVPGACVLLWGRVTHLLV